MCWTVHTRVRLIHSHRLIADSCCGPRALRQFRTEKQLFFAFKNVTATSCLIVTVQDLRCVTLQHSHPAASSALSPPTQHYCDSALPSMPMQPSKSCRSSSNNLSHPLKASAVVMPDAVSDSRKRALLCVAVAVMIRVAVAPNTQPTLKSTGTGSQSHRRCRCSSGTATPRAHGP